MLRKGIAAAAILSVALFSVACAKSGTISPVKATPTPEPKAQVVRFLKALDKLDKQGDVWGKEFSTFMQYFPGMTFEARQAKYQQLLASFNMAKTSLMAIERPQVDKARALHDAYVTQASKMSQLLTVMQPILGQGMMADTGTQAQIQGLVDELALSEKQLKEKRQDLIAQFRITASDLAQ